MEAKSDAYIIAYLTLPLLTSFFFLLKMLLWCHSPADFPFSLLLAAFQPPLLPVLEMSSNWPSLSLTVLGCYFSEASIFISKLMSSKSISSPHRSSELRTHISQMCHHCQAFAFLLEHSISPFPPFSPFYCPPDTNSAFPDLSGLVGTYPVS